MALRTSECSLAPDKKHCFHYPTHYYSTAPVQSTCCWCGEPETFPEEHHGPYKPSDHYPFKPYRPHHPPHTPWWEVQPGIVYCKDRGTAAMPYNGEAVQIFFG